MNHWKKTLAGLALGVSLAGTAAAKELYTAPASADFAGEDLYCVLQNSGKTPQLARFEIRDYQGNLVSGAGPFTWQPGEISGLVSYPGDGSTYCWFEVMGSGKSMRAHAVYIDRTNKRPTITVPAR